MFKDSYVCFYYVWISYKHSSWEEKQENWRIYTLASVLGACQTIATRITHCALVLHNVMEHAVACWYSWANIFGDCKSLFLGLEHGLSTLKGNQKREILEIQGFQDLARRRRQSSSSSNLNPSFCYWFLAATFFFAFSSIFAMCLSISIMNQTPLRGYWWI